MQRRKLLHIALFGAALSLPLWIAIVGLSKHLGNDNFATREAYAQHHAIKSAINSYTLHKDLRK